LHSWIGLGTICLYGMQVMRKNPPYWHCELSAKDIVSLLICVAMQVWMYDCHPVLFLKIVSLLLFVRINSSNRAMAMLKEIKI
jgi:hypothetical protein